MKLSSFMIDANLTRFLGERKNVCIYSFYDVTVIEVQKLVILLLCSS